MAPNSSLEVLYGVPNKLDEFTELVAAGDYHGLRKFIDENSREVEYFVSENVQVLEVALQNQHLAIYALLSSEGFTICEDSKEAEKYRETDKMETTSGNTGKSEFDEELVKSLGSANERTSMKLSKIRSTIPGLEVCV